MFRSPKFRRSMSDAEFYGFAIPLSLMAAAGIAALSMIVYLPFEGVTL